MFYNTFGGGQAASSPIEIVGNGPVYHNNGLVYGRAFRSVSPLLIDDPDGIGNPPLFRMLPQTMTVASGTIDAQQTGDQTLAVEGVFDYVIRRIVLSDPSAPPETNARVGAFTARNATGIEVLASQALTGLDAADPYRIVDVPVALGKYHRAPFIHVRMLTPASAPMSFKITVIADCITSPKY